MTPKEKAEILVEKFMYYVDDSYNEPRDMAISCAIMAIDELIYYAESKYQLDWFKEIKNELEKL
jgi:hypothetical protein